MIGNLDHKIKELDNLLCDCIENYHDPEKFFTYSHSLIQALRNFTFAVQANKKHIPDFEIWYSPWQQAMKADHAMKWLHNKRTQVVHEDIIASKSFAILTTLPDYSEVWIERRFDYQTSTHKVIEATKKIILEKPALAHAIMQIERAYLVEVAKKPRELVGLLAHAFTFICVMAEDLEIYLKQEGNYQGPPLNLGADLDNHHTLDDSFRYMQFKVKSGESVRTGMIAIKRDEKMIKAAAKRYGPSQFATISKMEADDAAKELFRMAKIMLKKDGSYLTMVFIHTPDGYQPAAVTFRDRADKILFSHELASNVKRLGGDAVIFITEAWLSEDVKRALQRIKDGKEVSGMRKKLEALTLMMLCKNKDTLTITNIFHRTKDGKISMSEDIIEHPEASTMGFLLPTLALWGKD